MKRLLAITLILAMLIPILSGCREEAELEPIDDEGIRTAILEEFLSLSEIPREPAAMKPISSYLRSWAKQNDFSVTRDDANNIIIEKPAAPGYENAPVTILQCNMDMIYLTPEDEVLDPLDNSIKILTDENHLWGENANPGAGSGVGISSILYILKYGEKHGPLRAIFTADGETSMSGAEKIKEKYLAGDYLINFRWEDAHSVGVGSGEKRLYTMSRPITWKEPTYTIPYLVSISDLSGGDADEELSYSGANAIKIVGNALAEAQGKGILLELGSFNAGIEENTIASAATALVIINQSDRKKFESAMKSAASDFHSHYGSAEKGVKFHYERTEMPEHVMSWDDSSSILSFIYGMVNGIQHKTADGEIESYTNLGTVSTYTGNFLAKVSAGSLSSAQAQEIAEAHEMVSRLSDLDYQEQESAPLWATAEENELTTTFATLCKELYHETPRKNVLLPPSECGWFAQKNPDLQMLSIGPTIHDGGTAQEVLELKTITRPATLVLTFLEQAVEKEKIEEEM